MEPVVYILAIMGCQQGYASCEPVAVMPTRYESAAACDAGAVEAVRHPLTIDIDQPLAMAECLRMDAAAAALLMAGDVKQLDPAAKPRPDRRRLPWVVQRARG